MARVQFGGGITGMQGSIAGTTFQRNVSGNVARTRVTAPVPASQLRNNVLLQTFNLNNLFRTLNPTQYGNWLFFAAAHNRKNKFGVMMKQSAQSWFISINTHLIYVGEVALLNPPTYIEPDGVILDFINSHAGSLTVTTTPTDVPDLTAWVLYTTPPLSGYSNSFDSKLRLTHIYDTAAAPFDYNFYGDWTDVHSLPNPFLNPGPCFIAVEIYAVQKVSGLICPASDMCYPLAVE